MKVIKRFIMWLPNKIISAFQHIRRRIIQYFKNRKERKRLEEDARLRSEFKVVERGGYLWLTHDGVAFMKINSVAYASDAVKELLMARDTAVEFKKL